MIARLSLKSASKNAKMLAMGALLVTIGGAFAACSAASSDGAEGTDTMLSQDSLPYTVKPCPGHGCK
jgi:hypothetical protein